MDSYLSENIKALVCDTFKEERLKRNNYITNNLTLNWDNINPLLKIDQESFSIHEQSTEWLIKVITSCTNVWKQSQFFMQEISNVQKCILLENCIWTNRQNDLQIYLEKYINNPFDETVNTEIVLFLTSVLERSLGNAYLLQGTNVPFLLRDLLGTPELITIFGRTPIVLLQILLGTPKAINLRNLVWHGFPNPSEIHPSFGPTLFIIISSLGDILQKKNIALKDVMRKQIDVKENFNKIGTNLGTSDIHVSICEHIENSVKISKYINANFLIVWKAILDHYTNEAYGQCLILLLPQIEQLLRNVFCDINDQPKRLLTAEADTFYTTLDDVLDEYVKDAANEKRKNKLYEILTPGLIEIINDTFTYLLGPRIRDKMSHGEINLDDIPKTCIDVLFIIVADIIAKVENTTEFTVNANSYKSIYHPASVLKSRILKSIEQIHQLRSLQAPTDVKIMWKSNDKEVYDVYYRIIGIIYNEFPKGLEICQITPIINNSIKCLRLVYTAYRPKHDAEIVSILRRITENVIIVAENIWTSLNEKLKLFTTRKLRSKRRETFLKLIETLPLFYSRLHIVVYLVIISFRELQRGAENLFDEHYIRYLKYTLKHVENLATNFEPNRNRWEESIQLTNNYIQKTNDLMNHISKKEFYSRNIQ